MTDKPRAVFLGKTMLPEPLGDDLQQKFIIVARYLQAIFIGVGTKRRRNAKSGLIVTYPALRPPFIGGLVFYSFAPPLAMLLSIARRRTAIVCQSAYEAFPIVLASRVIPKALRPKLFIEVHGDWRTSLRLYGSSWRRFLAPAADRISVWSLLRADRVRVVSDFLEDLVREAGYGGDIDKFVAFSDYEMFLDPPISPPPCQPRAAFVGVLEPYKGIDVLIDAWQRVIDRIPGATLYVAGHGMMLRQLRKQIEELGLKRSVTLLGRLPRTEIRELLDQSVCLVLPSRSEGLGLVVLEAMARARPVVASKVGGIRETVHHERNGLLTPPGDATRLADALVELLGKPELARSMGADGRRRVLRRDPAREFEAGIARLAAWIDGQS